MEQWRGVLGYEDWYEVSDLGRCRAIHRPIRGGPRVWRDPYPLILTPLRYRKGYYKIQLGACNGTRKRQRLFLHRMVWEAFNGRIPSRLTVNHLDANRANNALDNLELATFVRQYHHAAALGLQWHRTKTGRRVQHITAENVREIRRLHAAGCTAVALSEHYHVSSSTVDAILHRRTWKHIP